MTPAIRALEAAGIPFTRHEYDHEPSARRYGVEAAAALGLASDQVFKTLLVTTGAGEHAVAVVPVSGQLSLKAMSAALGTKRVEMADPLVAQRVTGYVVGGISPFGQRTPLPTVIDETCELYDTVYVSGGRRGLDVGVDPAVLVRLLGATVAAIAA